MFDKATSSVKIIGLCLGVNFNHQRATAILMDDLVYPEILITFDCMDWSMLTIRSSQLLTSLEMY